MFPCVFLLREEPSSQLAQNPPPVCTTCLLAPTPSQGVLLLLAFVSIPVLLLAKPLTIRSRMNKRAGRRDSFSCETRLVGSDHTPSDKPDSEHAAGGEAGGHEEHDFSEIVIHQVHKGKSHVGIAGNFESNWCAAEKCVYSASESREQNPRLPAGGGLPALA